MEVSLDYHLYDAFVDEHFVDYPDLQKEYYKEVHELLDYNTRKLHTEGVTHKALKLYKNFLQASISKEVLISITEKALKKNSEFTLKNDPVLFHLTPSVDQALHLIKIAMQEIREHERKQQELANLKATFRKRFENPITRRNIELLNKATRKPRTGLTGPSNAHRKTLELSRRTYPRRISFNPKRYIRRIPRKEENQSYKGRIPSSTRRVSKPLFSHYTRKGRLPRVIESPPRKQTAFNRFRNTARNSMSKVKGFFRL